MTFHDENYFHILVANFDECLIESNEPLTTSLLKFTFHIENAGMNDWMQPERERDNQREWK